MSRAHGRQELPCNSWVGKFLRNSGQCLNIKRQVGVLLWEHRGWMLHMAFSYKAKKYCVQQHAFLCSNIQHSTFHHSLKRMVPLSLQKGMTRNLLTKIKCFLSLGEIIVHPNLGALNKPSLTMVKKNYSSSTFAFIGILPLPGRSRFVKIYLTLQSLTAFCFSLRPPSSGYSCIRHYLLVPYGF